MNEEGQEEKQKEAQENTQKETDDETTASAKEQLAPSPRLRLRLRLIFKSVAGNSRLIELPVERVFAPFIHLHTLTYQACTAFIIQPPQHCL